MFVASETQRLITCTVHGVQPAAVDRSGQQSHEPLSPASESSSGESFDDDGYVGNDTQLRELVHSGNFACDPPAFGLVDDIYSSDSAEDAPALPIEHNKGHVLTCFADSIRIVRPTTTKDCTTPGHILLNAELGLLKRRSRPLSHGARSAHFLQSIASRNGTHPIPNLYPEGMLFSSLFWHSRLASITGALPAPLWTLASSRIIKSTVASAEDHLRTRLMDGSLLSGNDSRYLELTFVAIV